jgi:hypothetical protein
MMVPFGKYALGVSAVQEFRVFSNIDHGCLRTTGTLVRTAQVQLYRNTLMKIEDLENALVQRAIAALNAGDRAAWFDLFTQDATLTDDGNPRNFLQWSDSEVFGKGRGHLTSIDREEDGGLTLYGTFYSAQWGSFKTFFRFHQRGDKFSGLDVGQVDS